MILECVPIRFLLVEESKGARSEAHERWNISTPAPAQIRFGDKTTCEIYMVSRGTATFWLSHLPIKGAIKGPLKTVPLKAVTATPRY